ncbi:MAG: hypothetical protein AAGH79_04910 [Bacteroidota bacterium]
MVSSHYLIFIFSLLLVSVSSCRFGGSSVTQNVTSQKAALEDLLPGRWEHRQLFVSVQGYKLSDSIFTIQVNPGEWEEKLRVKRVITQYEEDHTYRMLFYSSSDSLEKTIRGMWNTFGDTTLLHVEPDGTYEYKISRNGKEWILESMIDWDEDSQMDDLYRLTIEPVKEEKKKRLLR